MRKSLYVSLLVGFTLGMLSPVYAGCKSDADCPEGEVCCKVGLRSTCIEPENCFNFRPETLEIKALLNTGEKKELCLSEMPWSVIPAPQ